MSKSDDLLRLLFNYIPNVSFKTLTKVPWNKIEILTRFLSSLDVQNPTWMLKNSNLFLLLSPPFKNVRFQIPPKRISDFPLGVHDLFIDKTTFSTKIMNKLTLRGIRFTANPKLFDVWVNSFSRSYTKSTKDKDEKLIDVEDVYKIRKGILHDKKQSLQEESYFHREEAEQLRQLKKKITSKKTEKEDKKE